MYNAGYGFANNNAAHSPAFNNAGQQPGAQPNAQQQAMFNQQQQQQQQFAGMAPQGAFGPGANPQMMAASQAGMMPNAAMQHMAANGQMPGYQQQFPGGPYGQVVPSTVGPQSFAPQYMMAAGGMQGFPMNPAGMPQQPQMMQRMQQPQQQPQQQQQQQQQQQPQHQPQQQQQPPPQQQPQPPNAAVMSQASTPQRPPSAAQGTPTTAAGPQGQFSSPQPPSQGQGQTPTGQQQQQQQIQQQQQQLQQQQATQQQQAQQQQPGMSTPQTPTFPHNPGMNANGAPAVGTPMSPGADAREKERFALLLDINHELLYEAIQIQATQQEIKKEHAAEGNAGEKKPSEEEGLLQQDYLQCMRRLQANLSFMAAMADRKPEVKAPPCPAFLSAPPLNLAAHLRPPAVTQEGTDNKIDPVADREGRDKSLKDLYLRLQAVFPGCDPKKEPAFRMPSQGAQGQKPGNAAANQASPTAQKTPQMTKMSAPAMQQPGMPS